MESPYLIPIIVTLVTAMSLGAIYLLVQLLNDGKPAQEDEDPVEDPGQDPAQH